MNNWNTSTDPQGQTLPGKISASRFFKIVCIGILGGWIIDAPVIVGTVDLSVASAAIEGLEPLPIVGGYAEGAYIAAPHKVLVTIKNSGNASATSFKIRYYISTDPTVPYPPPAGVTSVPGEFISVDGIGGAVNNKPASKSIVIERPKPGGVNSLAEATRAFYHKVCIEGAIIGENETANNCKILAGSYKYVNYVR